VVIIGVDPHKRTHTASALEPGTHQVLATLQIDATLAGYRQLARWAARFEARRWAVENARTTHATFTARRSPVTTARAAVWGCPGGWHRGRSGRPPGSCAVAVSSVPPTRAAAVSDG
jgi:hypothetical protein